MMFKKKKKNASMMITDDEVSVEGEENLDNPLSKIKDKLSLMKKKDSDKENSSEDNKEEHKDEDLNDNEEEKEEIRKDLEEDNNRSIDDNKNTEKKDNKDLLDIMYGDEEEKEEDNILLNESKKDEIKEEDNHKDDLIDINYGDDDKENNNEEDNIIEDKEKEDFNDKKNKIKEDHPKRDLIDIKYDKDDGKKKHHKEENKTDFNTDFIKNNHPTKPIYKKITGLITDIILIILIGYFVVWISPKIVNWFSGGREKYVDLAKSMTVQVKNSFDVSKKGCSTSINHRYFFNIYNSKEQFGDEYVSPIDGQPMEGYIEFELYNSDYTTYITLSDGFFGINHVKLEELSKSDIKVFTFLGLDTYEDMKCNKPIEITRK